MDHLLKCHMLPQECATEDVVEYNEAANGVCFPVDEECVVTGQ